MTDKYFKELIQGSQVVFWKTLENGTELSLLVNADSMNLEEPVSRWHYEVVQFEALVIESNELQLDTDRTVRFSFPNKTFKTSFAALPEATREQVQSSKRVFLHIRKVNRTSLRILDLREATAAELRKSLQHESAVQA